MTRQNSVTNICGGIIAQLEIWTDRKFQFCLYSHTPAEQIPNLPKVTQNPSVCQVRKAILTHWSLWQSLRITNVSLRTWAGGTLALCESEERLCEPSSSRRVVSVRDAVQEPSRGSLQQDEQWSELSVQRHSSRFILVHSVLWQVSAKQDPNRPQSQSKEVLLGHGQTFFCSEQSCNRKHIVNQSNVLW